MKVRAPIPSPWVAAVVLSVLPDGHSVLMADLKTRLSAAGYDVWDLRHLLLGALKLLVERGAVEAVADGWRKVSTAPADRSTVVPDPRQHAGRCASG